MAATTSKTSKAWLLTFGKDYRAAVGAHEMTHVLLDMDYHKVPCSPSYCDTVVIWEKHILPVLDVPSLLEKDSNVRYQHRILGVAIYQEDPTHPLIYNALSLITMPENILVEDSNACELPSHLSHWKEFAISCFLYEGEAVPVLDLNYLFTGIHHRDVS